MHVSSANKVNCSILEHAIMSFIYRRNNKGPSILPCGTPHLIYSTSDKESPIETLFSISQITFKPEIW